MKFENITDSFDYVKSITVIEENEQTTYASGEENFDKIIAALKQITEFSHEMPAFGVSLDDLTKEDKKAGTWIELEFDGVCSHEAMSFEALLIKVEADNYGFNLIRRNNGKYEGRCFYISMDGNMKALSDAISSL